MNILIRKKNIRINSRTLKRNPHVDVELRVLSLIINTADCLLARISTVCKM